jgi:hypothetical protein
MHPENPEIGPAAKPVLSVTALSLADAALLLTRAGTTTVTVEMLNGDFARGAPVNADGTLNLVHYAAWLVKVVKEVARGD